MSVPTHRIQPSVLTIHSQHALQLGGKHRRYQVYVQNMLHQLLPFMQ